MEDQPTIFQAFERQGHLTKMKRLFQQLLWGFSYQIKPLYTHQEPFKLAKGNIPTCNNMENKKLVGGFNPFEKYDRQNGLIFPK